MTLLCSEFNRRAEYQYMPVHINHQIRPVVDVEAKHADCAVCRASVHSTRYLRL